MDVGGAIDGGVAQLGELAARPERGDQLGPGQEGDGGGNEGGGELHFVD